MHEAWSTEQFYDDVWQDYLKNLSMLTLHAQQQSEVMTQQQDLVTKLLAFCADVAN
jgi:hypothetical protein